MADIEGTCQQYNQKLLSLKPTRQKKKRETKKTTQKQAEMWKTLGELQKMTKDRSAWHGFCVSLCSMVNKWQQQK